MSQTFLSLQSLKFWPIILLPALLALGLILHFSVDVPFWSEWRTPGYIYERIIEGSIEYRDFFSQHNEHRMLFPKLIFIAVGFTLGWHVTAFMVLSWIFVLLTFFIILKMLPESTKVHPLIFTYIALLLGGLLFSPSQWENQLMGINLTAFIPPLCLALCLLLQSTLKSYGFKTMALAILSIISTFSFANGMVVWLLAFPFIRTWLSEEWKTRPDREKIKIICWTALYLVIGAATIRYYFWDYQSTLTHKFLSIFWQNPLFALKYYLTWLGSPLSYGQVDSALIVGIGILLLVLVSFVVIKINWRKSPDNAVLNSRYPWICFVLYGLLSGLAITGGRAHFGLEYALSSRYTTNSLWVIVGLLGIFYAVLVYERSKHRSATIVTYECIIGIVSVLTVLSWFGGYRSMQAASLRSQQHLLTLRLLDAAPSNPLLNHLWAAWPNTEGNEVRRRASMFIEHGILDVPQIGNWLNEEIQAPHGKDAGWFRVSNNENENKIFVSGWAMLPNRGVPADFVVLAKKDQSGNIEIVTGLTNRMKRPDVVEEKHNPKLILSGFEDSLETTDIEGNRFLMFAVDLKNQRLYELRQRNATY